MVSPIQVIAVVFALFAMSRVYSRLKDSNLTAREFMFWTVLWLLVVIVAFLPDATTDLALLLGIEKGLSLIVSLGFIVLFYLVFRLYVKIENQNQELTRIVRELAIRKKRK